MFPQALGPHHEPQALERHAEQLHQQPLAKASGAVHQLMADA